MALLKVAVIALFGFVFGVTCQISGAAGFGPFGYGMGMGGLGGVAAPSSLGIPPMFQGGQGMYQNMAPSYGGDGFFKWNPSQTSNSQFFNYNPSEQLNTLGSMSFAATQEAISGKDKTGLTRESCADCDRFSTEMLDISTDAHPGSNADADAQLCERVSPEFKSSCESYIHKAGGVGDVDVLIQESPDTLCEHLEQCQDLNASFLAASSSEESGKKKRRKGKKSATLGVPYSLLNSMTNQVRETQAIQMMNSKQMSDMELMNNALKLHDMQLEPALHRLPCLNPDDPDCATDGLIHGMNYLMMSNSLPNGGLDNGGLGLSMMASAFPTSPNQQAGN